MMGPPIIWWVFAIIWWPPTSYDGPPHHMTSYDGIWWVPIFQPRKRFSHLGFFLLPKIYFNVDFFGPKHCPSEKCGGLGTQHHLELRHLPFFGGLTQIWKPYQKLKFPMNKIEVEEHLKLRYQNPTSWNWGWTTHQLETKTSKLQAPPLPFFPTPLDSMQGSSLTAHCSAQFFSVFQGFALYQGLALFQGCVPFCKAILWVFHGGLSPLLFFPSPFLFSSFLCRTSA